MDREETLTMASDCLNYTNIVHYAGKSLTSEEIFKLEGTVYQIFKNTIHKEHKAVFRTYSRL